MRGSAFADAVDHDVATSYFAASAPAEGDALVVTLSTPQPLDRVTVLQAADSTAPGKVEVRTADGWQPAGKLHGAYTAVTMPVTTVEAIRISWAAGAVPPQVHEVIPRGPGK